MFEQTIPQYHSQYNTEALQRLLFNFFVSSSWTTDSSESYINMKINIQDGWEVGIPLLFFARICVPASGVPFEWQVTGTGNNGLLGDGNRAITLPCAVEFQTWLLIWVRIPSSKGWCQRCGVMKDLTPATTWRQCKWNFETALVLNRQESRSVGVGETRFHNRQCAFSKHCLLG
jgi:hypothetical protein